VKTDYTEKLPKIRFHLTSLLREFALGRIHSFVPPQLGHPPLARLTGSRPNKGKTYRYSNVAFVIKNSDREFREASTAKTDMKRGHANS
jgi:hypothetical protein